METKIITKIEEIKIKSESLCSNEEHRFRFPKSLQSFIGNKVLAAHIPAISLGERLKDE